MPDLSNAQVLSILNKMLVEQQTLPELWKQFTVALKQVDVVITRYEEISKLLPSLEAERLAVQNELSSLKPVLENNKKSVAEEVERHRSALETELSSLRNSVSTERARLASTKADFINFEKSIEDRKVVLTTDMAAAETRLASIKQEFVAFKQKHGFGDA